MDFANYYYNIYLFIIAIASFYTFSSYRKRRVGIRQNDNIPGFLMFVFITLFIGLRPISGVFVDMVSYAQYYELFVGESFVFNDSAENVIFDNIMPFMASKGFSPTIYFLVIAVGYLGFMYWACRRFFGNNSYAAFLVCLGAFSTFSYGTNGIKAGLAASFFLLAMSYMDKLWICIPLALLSKGLHHSMTLPIVAFICALIYSKPKYYFYIWIFCILMAIGHVGVFANFFAGLTDERGAEYLIGEKTTNIGFRLDFILYSAMPVWLGWKYLKKNPEPSLWYRRLLCSYLLTNSVWMLCMYANFNNRIAYLSWFMYPVVLIYPMLKDKWAESRRYAYFSKVASYHLAFTIFMQVVYYGILQN